MRHWHASRASPYQRAPRGSGPALAVKLETDENLPDSAQVYLGLPPEFGLVAF